MQLQNLQTGQRIDVWRSAFLLRHPDTQEPFGYATVTRDITERKRQERALHEAAERHRLALEVSGLGTWDWDIRSGELTWDERCRAIFGFPPDERVTYQAFLEQICPADRDPVDAAVQACLAPAHSGDYDVEFRICLKDGTERWARSKGQVFFTAEDGRRAPTRMTGATLDITEQRTRQAELESRVAERTRELTAANERLQELDRLKSEFLASMSHELRTPLNSIIGFTEIVVAGLAGPLNEEQGKQLQMSLNSSRHLLSLINDLLDLARIESGRATPHYESFNLRDVLRTVENTLSPLAAKKELVLRVQAPEQVPVLSDRKMVYQIILNLAGNAVKFTPRGRIDIVCEPAGDNVRISVSDTGIGIRPQNMKLLFEAFRQVDGSARRKFEGTGLGLHLSQRLARLLGGTIDVDSEFGRGSRFTVNLPVRGAPVP
jgi:PAS domain S-box-containing protein